MKIRSGFVSNSSSSSFVIVAPKAAVDKVLGGLKNDYERAVVKHIMKKEKFLGQSICVFSGATGNYDSWEYNFDASAHDGFVSEDDEDAKDDEISPYPSDVFDDFCDKLKKETKDVITVESDF